MTIIFSGVTKHQGKEFLPNVATDFLDDRVEEYFVSAGWAAPTSDAPVVTFPEGYVTVDPNTVDNLTGAKILTPQAVSLEEAKARAEARAPVHQYLTDNAPPDPLSVQANEEVLAGKQRSVQPERKTEPTADTDAPATPKKK